MHSPTDNSSPELDVRHLLKVLAGPNAGARAVLESGGYSVGASLNCDLVLHDNQLAEQQLTLQVFNQDVYLSAQPGQVAVNGQLQVDQQVVLHPFDVVTFGNSRFAIGPVAARWPDDVSLLTMAPTRSQPLPVVATMHGAKSASARVNPRARSKKMPALVRYLGIAGLGLLAIGLLTRTVVTPVEAIVDTDLSERSAQRAVALMNLENSVKVSKDESDRVEVTGYVMDTVQEIELEERIDNLNVPVVMRIWNTEDLAQFATTVAAAMGAGDVRASAVAPGEIAFSGYVDNDTVWQSALSTIRRDIPAIRKIDDASIQTRDRASQVIQELLVKNNLAGSVSVASENSEIIATGVLKEDDMPAWTRVVNAYKSSHDHLPPVVDRVRAEQEVEISIPVRSVSIAGEEAYLVTRSGTRYATGGVLSGGYQIVGIFPDRIVVQKDSRNYVYNLGVKDDSKQ